MSNQSSKRQDSKPLKMDRKTWVANAIAAATRSVEQNSSMGRGKLPVIECPDRSRFV